ncbi:MAG: heparinase II/III family protein [Coprobacillus sp.]
MEKLRKRIKKYYDNFDEQFCREYILKNCENEYREILNSSDLLLNNIFIFDRTWDMEPCPTPYSLEDLVWDYTPNNDNEWIFMLNRHDYFDKLIVSYIVTKDIKYIDKLKYFIFNWIESVKDFSVNNKTTRTIDTGIRCFVWLRSLMFMINMDIIDDNEIAKILTSLEKQIHFLRDNYIDKYSLSNWGILQTTSIIACYKVLNQYIHIEEANTFAIEELLLQLELQILDDGTQWEQSIMYHIEVYKALIHLVLIDKSLYNLLCPILRRMANYIKAMTTPSYQQIASGDSDFSDTRSIMILSSIVLKDSQYINPDCFVDVESLLLLGKKGVQYFESLEINKFNNESYYFENSGIICIRNKGSYLYFKNGPMSSGHSHSDENSLCIYYQKKAIFIDPGRFTYNDCEERYYLKSSFSHSGCIVDDCPPEYVKDSWDYGMYPQPIHTEFKCLENIYYIEGSYTAYNSRQDLYLWKRKVVMIDDDIFLINDDISMNGNHFVTRGFILDPSVDYQNECLNELKMISDMEYEIKDTIISKRYNEIELSTKIIGKSYFKDRYVGNTLLCNKKYDVIKHQVYQVNGIEPIENAFAYEIKDYIIVMLNDEIYTGNKLCLVAGVKIRGKSVVYNKKTKKRVCLRS